MPCCEIFIQLFRYNSVYITQLQVHIQAQFTHQLFFLFRISNYTEALVELIVLQYVS